MKINDSWLNSHIGPLLESWQANVDFQLIIDSGKVVRYMTKYVTKAESSMTKGIAAMIRNIMRNTIREGLSVQAALKRTMAKLLDERMISKQETCHLILSIPMVNCSHQFVRINLENNVNRIDIG